MAKVDEGVAFAAIGVAVVEAINIYRGTAPSLMDVRCADPSHAGRSTTEGMQFFAAHQQIIDADMLALIVVVAIGGGGAVLIRRAYPLLLAAAALLALSGYYRWVLRSPNGGLKRNGSGEGSED